MNANYGCAIGLDGSCWPSCRYGPWLVLLMMYSTLHLALLWLSPIS